MRSESLRLLLEAARINPSATLPAVAGENDEYAEALIDVYAGSATGNAKSWSVESWDTLLEEIDSDPRTLAQYVDTPQVRALVRAQEANHANA
jgi:hypothetical protein